MTDFKRYLPSDASLPSMHLALGRLWDALEAQRGVTAAPPVRVQPLGSSPTFLAASGSTGTALRHNTLPGLQGGDTDNYYHLKSDEYTGTGTGIFVRQDSPTINGTATFYQIVAGEWLGTKIGLAYGGTNADLSATGGTAQVLRQSTLGGAVTVGQLAGSEITNTPTGNIAATDVQAALNELDTEKVPTTRAISTTAPLTGGGDMSADRTLAISAATTVAAGSMSAADKAKLDGIAAGATANLGTVTSVAALTLGTTGTDLSSTVANGTTTPVITLNVPTASGTNRGVLSATDWTAFNSKQAALGFTPINKAGDTGIGNLSMAALTTTSNTTTNSIGTDGQSAWDINADGMGINTRIKFANTQIGGQTLGLGYLQWLRDTSQGRTFSVFTCNAIGTSVEAFKLDGPNGGTATFSSSVSMGALTATSGYFSAGLSVIGNITASVSVAVGSNCGISTVDNSTFYINPSGPSSFNGNAVSMGALTATTGIFSSNVAGGSGTTIYTQASANKAQFSGNWSGTGYWGIWNTVNTHELKLGMCTDTVGTSTTGASLKLIIDGSVSMGALTATQAGFNGKTPQASYAVNAACTDLATAVALINQLRAALVANGICI